jgi:regulator of protease activity HflC (stomatin/prohibitin superfamily)
MNIADVIRGIATLAWLAALGALGLVVFSAARGRRLGGGIALIAGAVIVAVTLTVAAAGIVFIEPNERAVVVSPYDPDGYRDQVLTPGLRWIIPGEQTRIYSISQENYTMSSTPTEGPVQGDDSVPARTKDGQEVTIDASVLFAIDPDKVIQLHIALQNNYVERVVRPQARSIIRDVVSQYGVEEVVSTKRAEMEELITAALDGRFQANNLILADFLVRNIRFSDEYAAAVEQKQIAEQQAQQAAFVVEQRRQEAEQARQVAQGQADAAIIQAEGRARATVLQAEAEAEARVIQARAEAEALGLIAGQLRDNPDLLTFRYIEKLAPNVQVMYLPANSPYLLPLPSGQSATSVVVTPEETETPSP